MFSNMSEFIIIVLAPAAFACTRQLSCGGFDELDR